MPSGKAPSVSKQGQSLLSNEVTFLLDVLFQLTDGFKDQQNRFAYRISSGDQIKVLRLKDTECMLSR
jgi:hypothetical protein